MNLARLSRAAFKDVEVRVEDVFPLLISAILLILASIVYFGHVVRAELGVNLFSSALSVLFTVGLIDQSIRMSNRWRQAPLFRLAKDDASDLLEILKGTWRQVVESSLQGSTFVANEIYSPIYVNIVVDNFDERYIISSKAENGSVDVPLEAFLRYRRENIRSQIARFISRYNGIAKSEIVFVLSNIETYTLDALFNDPHGKKSELSREKIVDRTQTGVQTIEALDRLVKSYSK